MIRIVRFEDEPKAKLIARFKLTEVQAEAILNLRLKSLSKLEEIEIKAEHDKLSQGAARAQSAAQVGRACSGSASPTRSRRRASATPRRPSSAARRTSFAEAPAIEVDLDQAMIEKEPITVVLSEKGWIRAMKGHIDDLAKLEFKQGDGLKRAVKAYTTDKLLVLATNGKVFTLRGDQLPGGRGHGEPVRLMVDLEENHDVRGDLRARAGAQAARRLDRRLRLRRAGGRDASPSTRKGKQVMNVSRAGGGQAAACRSRAITSPPSARTARCWSSRSTRSTR